MQPQTCWVVGLELEMAGGQPSKTNPKRKRWNISLSLKHGEAFLAVSSGLRTSASSRFSEIN